MNLMPPERTPRNGCMGLHMVIGAAIVVQGIHLGNALPMERNVVNVAKKITSKWYAGPCRGNRQTSDPKC